MYNTNCIRSTAASLRDHESPANCKIQERDLHAAPAPRPQLSHNCIIRSCGRETIDEVHYIVYAVCLRSREIPVDDPFDNHVKPSSVRVDSANKGVLG